MSFYFVSYRSKFIKSSIFKILTLGNGIEVKAWKWRSLVTIKSAFEAIAQSTN